MNSSHVKQKTFCQLCRTVEDQSSQSLLTDSINHETKPPPHNDASLFSTPFSQEESKVRELSQSKIKTPTNQVLKPMLKDSPLKSLPQKTEGEKCFYPFHCKQSPQQVLLSKGINCKK